MYRHINDRSNLDEVVAIRPKTATTPQVQITRREDLARSAMVRNDIVLFNGTRSGREYVLFVAEHGFAGDVWLLDLLTDAEYAEVQGIAERMRANALAYEPSRKLLARRCDV